MAATFGVMSTQHSNVAVVELSRCHTCFCVTENVAADVKSFKMNLEIMIYSCLRLLASESILTFKDALCLITQKNIKQVDSLSCQYSWNVSKASSSFDPSSSEAIRLLCVPLCRRQAMIALGYVTTVCSQIGLH